MNKGFEKAVVETVVIVAAVVIVLPVVAAGLGAVVDSTIWAGQITTNIVKDQINKRKKVKVEEVEED